ncbi:MAG: methyltransferase domain-containing protein [Fimbriimonadaceae bacterium]|jgi:ubiquinone/menaquinone biosynthesis C-methylase UbiE|nr:methyltransferase domain-containing protein [Fimbriimonadaceae bacterium]
MQRDEYGKMRELEDHYWWFVARRQVTLDLIRDHAKPGDRILDVGSGTGALLQELQAQYQAAGVDFSPLALGYSRSRGLTNLSLGNAEELPFASDSFDLVVSLDTIEHVPQDQKAVAEIFRVLAPGGTFVMNVPAFKWLWGPHDIALMHYRRYTKGQVRSLLRQAGFRVDKASYFVFTLFPIVVARRIVEKFDRGPAVVRMPVVSDMRNRALIRLMQSEAKFFHRFGLPWGSSVMAVGKKPFSGDER